MRFLRLKKPREAEVRDEWDNFLSSDHYIDISALHKTLFLICSRLGRMSGTGGLPHPGLLPAGEKERYGQGSGNSGEEGPAQPYPARGEPQPVSVNLKKAEGAVGGR